MSITSALFAGQERRSGEAPGPSEIQRRRALADALFAQGSKTDHIDHPLEAVASIVQSGVGAWTRARADRDERDGRKARNQGYLDAYDALDSSTALNTSFGGGSATGGGASSSVLPGLPSISPPAGATSTAAAGPSSSALPASFLASVDRTEGGGNYDTLFGHSQRSGPFSNVRISNMTVGQAIDFASPSGAYGQFVKGKVGRVATPMGRHQIVGSTLRRAAAEMGIDPSTPFNAQTQDAVAAHLARRRIASAGSTSGKIAALRSEWEGFKHVPDNQMVQIIADLENGSSASVSMPQQPVQVASLDPSIGMSGPAPSGPNNDALVSALGTPRANISSAQQAVAAQLLESPQQSQPVPSAPVSAAPGATPSPDPVRLAQAQMLTQGQPMQPAQGVNRALIARLLENEWTEDIGQSLLMQQIETQQQANDPLRQIQLQKAQFELQQLQNPQSEYGFANVGGNLFRTDPRTGTADILHQAPADSGMPDAFQALQLRAQAAGYQPGTPEYQSFMASGGRSEASSEAEERIGRMTENLMQTGDFIDPQEARNIAVGIVDGRLRSDRHPITGEMQIVDMATGAPAYQPRGGAQAAQPSPSQSGALAAPATPMTEADRFGPQYQSGPQAFGVEGAARRVLNMAGDATGFGAPYPETQAAQADYSVLQESVLNDIASAYGRQPPSWLLQEIRNLTPTPGSPFEGPGSAVSKLNAIGRHLTNELRVTEEALGRSLSPTQRQEMEARQAGLYSAINRIDRGIASLDGRQESDPAEQGFPEGATATNPQTGVRIIFRNGAWEPLQ